MTIDQLLEYAVMNHASDLHITVGSVPVIRVDGKLIKLEEYQVRYNWKIHFLPLAGILSPLKGDLLDSLLEMKPWGIVWIS